jgi:heme-degrading monooxygenase HmoA
MICRVALHEKTPGNVTSDEARRFREWIKGQPGFVGGYHAQDSETGRMVSITVWNSQESMSALRDRTPPGARGDHDGSRGTLRRGGRVLGHSSWAAIHPSAWKVTSTNFGS